MYSSKITAILSVLHLAQAQSFLAAISTYPQLSNFSSLLTTNPDVATGLLSFSASSPQTVLVPNDDAFLNYQAATGQEITSSATDLLQKVVQYHTLDGSYSAESFSPQEGVTIPTLLTDETYNNRSAGAALSSVGATGASGGKNGQVVFIAPQTGSTFTIRQLSSEGAFVQTGLAARVNLTAVDGVWDGGRFQIIDGFLTLPQICTTTIDDRGLTSLAASLKKTGLADVLDHLSNVTCLGPNDQAFLAAGSPDSKLNATDLSGAILFHTIPQPLYSNFLESGQTFTTANNATVRVSLKDGDIFFNDAKVLQANVLTNNGLIHVLDRIMSPLEVEEPTETATTTSVVTATVTPSTTASGNASATTTGFTEVTGAAGNLRVQLPAMSLLQLFAAFAGFVL